jgi:hypothetical protein
VDDDGSATPFVSGAGDRSLAAWRQWVRKWQDAELSPPLRQRRNPHGNDRLGIVRLLSPQCGCKTRMMRFGPHVMCGEAVSAHEVSAAARLAGRRGASRKTASARRESGRRGSPRGGFRQSAAPRRPEMRRSDWPGADPRPLSGFGKAFPLRQLGTVSRRDR